MLLLQKISWFFTGERSQDSRWSWFVCISAAVINGANLGFVLSFGVLFPELMEYFGETGERTALVGSIAVGMVWLASPLVGYFCDRFGCRVTCFVGGTLCMAGLVSTSFVPNLTWMYCTYSAVYGLGTCFIYNPCFLIIAKYFMEKLSIATGIVSLGSSLGYLCTGPLLQALLDAYGWRDTFRIMVATYALVCILSLTFNPNVQGITVVETFTPGKDNNRVQTVKRNALFFYCSVWVFPAYTVFVVSLVLASFSMYIPFINLVKFSEDVGISPQKASRLSIFIGLASAVGRITTGRLCNDKRVNPVYIYQACLVIAALATSILPMAKEYWQIIIFSATFGLSEGVFITTQNFILLTCVDKKRRTAAFCINNLLYAFTAAAGGPVAALMADKTGDYTYSFYMTGGVLIAAALIPLILICVNRGKSKVVPEESEIEEKKDKFERVSIAIQTLDETEVLGKELRTESLSRKRAASAFL